MALRMKTKYGSSKWKENFWKQMRAGHSRYIELHESISNQEGRLCSLPWNDFPEPWQSHLLPMETWAEVPEAQGMELTHCCAL